MFDMISAISELINNCQCHGGQGAEAAELMEDQRLEQELLGETGDRKEALPPSCPCGRGHQGELWASGGYLGQAWLCAVQSC